MVQHLIVPVDGSDASWKAFDVALSLARRTASTVHVVEVVFSPADQAHAQCRLEQGVADVEAPDDIDIEVEVLLSAETVASAIEQAVTDVPGSTVVMSSHGRGRSAALVGSVAEDILHRTFGPILVVGPHVTVDDFSGPIVVSVDGSDESEAALPLAAAWGIELGSEPWILNVIGPSAPVNGSDVTDTMYTSRLAHQLSKQSGHPVQFEELHDGNPAVSIPEFATRMDASLIVASSHGRSGLSRLAFGSVTSGFVRHATCPVLVIRLPHPIKRWEDVDARAWAM